MQTLLTKLLDDLGVPKDGFFTVHVEQAAHPENVHFNPKDIEERMEKNQLAERKEWWPGDLEAQIASERQLQETPTLPEVSTAGTIEDSKIVESSFKSKIHRKTKTTPEPHEMLHSRDELDISLTEEDIDDILENRNVKQILQKVLKQEQKPKSIEKVENGQGKKPVIELAVESFETNSQHSPSQHTLGEMSDIENDREQTASEEEEEESASEHSASRTDHSSRSASEVSHSSSPSGEKYEEDFDDDEDDGQQQGKKYSSLEHSADEDEQDSEEVQGKEDLKSPVPRPETPKNTAVITYWNSMEDGSFDFSAKPPLNNALDSDGELAYNQRSMDGKTPSRKLSLVDAAPLADPQGTLEDEDRSSSDKTSSRKMLGEGLSPKVDVPTMGENQEITEGLANEVRHRRELFLQQIENSKPEPFKEEQGEEVEEVGSAKPEPAKSSLDEAEEIEESSYQSHTPSEEDKVEDEENALLNAAHPLDGHDIDEFLERNCTEDISVIHSTLLEDYEPLEDRSLRPLEPQEHPDLPPLSPIEEMPETPFMRSAKQNWELSIRQLESSDDDGNVDSGRSSENANNMMDELDEKDAAEELNDENEKDSTLGADAETNDKVIIQDWDVKESKEVGSDSDETSDYVDHDGSKQANCINGKKGEHSGIKENHENSIFGDSDESNEGEDNHYGNVSDGSDKKEDLLELSSSISRPVPAPRRRSKELSLEKSNNGLSCDELDASLKSDANLNIQQTKPDIKEEDIEGESEGEEEMEPSAAQEKMLDMPKRQVSVKNVLNKLALEESSEEDEDVCT